VSGWIFSGVLIPTGLVFVVLGITVWEASALWRLLLPLIWLAGTAILVWSTHWLPAMSYRAAGYIVTPRDIEIRRGILWKTVTTIPRSRVQHTDVQRGPLMRRFGIAKLIIHTAGTQHATVELPGLSRAEAERIRDHLVDRVDRVGRADSDETSEFASTDDRDSDAGAPESADIRPGAGDAR
jgi:membrane protein YdbS with pleckstrin-like domain